MMFTVIVKGSIIISELSKQSCQAVKNSFLDEHVLQGLKSKLIDGVISETFYIADAIRIRL